MSGTNNGSEAGLRPWQQTDCGPSPNRHLLFNPHMLICACAPPSRKSATTRRNKLIGRPKKPTAKVHADFPESPSPHVADEEMQKQKASSSKGLTNQLKGDQSADDAEKYLLYKVCASCLCYSIYMCISALAMRNADFVFRGNFLQKSC